MKIIKRNKNYRAIQLFPEKESNVFVLTFDHYRPSYDGVKPRPFRTVGMNNYITKIGYNNIHIQSKRNDWYQLPDFSEVTSEISSVKKPGDIYISYGTSMGAFAAASFSEALDTDFFLSVSPQASLSEKFMKSLGDNRWSENSSIFRDDCLLDGGCRERKGIISVDPSFKTDLSHAKAVADVTESSILRCWGSWHNSGIVLNKTYKIKNIITDIVRMIEEDGKIADLCEKIQQVINSGYAYRFMVASDERRLELITQEGIETFLDNVDQTAFRRSAVNRVLNRERAEDLQPDVSSISADDIGMGEANSTKLGDKLNADSKKVMLQGKLSLRDNITSKIFKQISESKIQGRLLRSTDEGGANYGISKENAAITVLIASHPDCPHPKKSAARFLIGHGYISMGCGLLEAAEHFQNFYSSKYFHEFSKSKKRVGSRRFANEAYAFAEEKDFKSASECIQLAWELAPKNQNLAELAKVYGEQLQKSGQGEAPQE